jgi:MEMO1 family protein
LKAVIAPHAGYRFSGPVAGSAYAQVAAIRDRIRRVVLVGPSHRVGFKGIAVSGAGQFQTPLGAIPIDSDAVRDLLRLPFVNEMEAAHAEEHSLEIQLPFLQRALGDFTLVPLVTGDASPEQVAEVLANLWDGPETLIVISTDLTHYLDYETARRIDAKTSEAIVAADLDAIGDHQACGRVGLKGLLALSRERGLGFDLLDLRNSGDTSGTRDRVVGYGAWAASAAPDAAGDKRVLARGHGRLMMGIARASIRHGLATGKEPAVALDRVPKVLRGPGASFITLRKAGKLRGCIGSAIAHQPLAHDVARNAFKAAFRDPRFQPLTGDEVRLVDLEISLLSEPEPFPISSEQDLIVRLRPGIDGLILSEGIQRALFLPAVWENLGDPRDFVAHLKRKAGWSADYWSDGIVANRFTAEKVAEPFPV